MEARVRPPEDEHSAGEDQLLAQVIPLRRRENEPEEVDLSPITPRGRALTGVFDPPEDPEPVEGYSVWEQPIAELIRRGEPTPTHKRRQFKAARIARRPRLLLAGGAVAALSCVLALALSGWLAGGPSPPAHAPAAAHASVSQPHAAVNGSGHARLRGAGARARSLTRSSTLGHTRATSRTTGNRHRSQPVSTPTTKQATASSTPQGASDTATPGNSEPTAPAQAPAVQAAAASVQATASHEFGFER